MTPPTRYALVPVDITPEMEAAVMREKGVPYWEWRFQNNYTAMLAASPAGGAVSAADLERAAEGRWCHVREVDRARCGYTDFHPWSELPSEIKKELIEEQRAAFEAAGLPVAECVSAGSDGLLDRVREDCAVLAGSHPCSGYGTHEQQLLAQRVCVDVMNRIRSTAPRAKSAAMTFPIDGARGGGE